MSDLEDRKSEVSRKFEHDGMDSGDLWSMYEKYRQLVDEEWMGQWKGLMDGTLIFAGLFSAVITTFIIESLQQMEPDSSQQTVQALETVSLQLKFIAEILQNSSTLSAVASASNATILPPQAYLASDTTDRTYVTVNILWALSLVSSLMCALCALLVQSWIHSYKARLDKAEGAPRSKSKRRFYIMRGFQHYGVYVFVAMIPTLLHLSVFLFLAGLVALFQSMDPSLGKMALILSAIFGGGYVLMSILCILLRDWPYDTPISMVLKAIIHKFSRFEPMEQERPNFTIFPDSEETLDAPLEYEDLFDVISKRVQYGTDEHAMFCKALLRLFNDDDLTSDGRFNIQALTLYQLTESLRCPLYAKGSDGIFHVFPHRQAALVRYLECVLPLVRSLSWDDSKKAKEVLSAMPEPWKSLASSCCVLVNTDEPVRALAIEVTILSVMVDSSPRQDDETIEGAVSTLRRNLEECRNYTMSKRNSPRLEIGVVAAEEGDRRSIGSSWQYGANTERVMNENLLSVPSFCRASINPQVIHPYDLLFTTFHTGQTDEHNTFFQLTGKNAVLEFESMGPEVALAKAIIEILEERGIARQNVEVEARARARANGPTHIAADDVPDLLESDRLQEATDVSPPTSIYTLPASVQQATKVMAQILPCFKHPEALFTINCHLDRYVRDFPSDEEMREMREKWKDELVQSGLAKLDCPQANVLVSEMDEKAFADEDGDPATQAIVEPPAQAASTGNVVQSPVSMIGGEDWNQCPPSMGPPLVILNHDPSLPPREAGTRRRYVRGYSSPSGPPQQKQTQEGGGGDTELVMPGGLQVRMPEPDHDVTGYSLPRYAPKSNL